MTRRVSEVTPSLKQLGCKAHSSAKQRRALTPKLREPMLLEDLIGSLEGKGALVGECQNRGLGDVAIDVHKVH